MDLQDFARAAAIGIGATATMDAWSMLMQRLGQPTLDYALVGRWLGHLRHGRWAHARIGAAAPVAGEKALGWLFHYAVGIAFALLLVLLCGAGWLHTPTFAPALALGLATVVLPFLVMQPAFGAGIAASRTPTPWRNRLRSMTAHAVFGCGLYLAAVGLMVCGL